VICEYLEERYPETPVFPTGPEARARMRWLEEYADSRMGEVLIWQLFNQQIRRAVWREEPDQAVLDAALHTHIPHILDFLESEVPTAGFLFGNVSVADVAIACFFRNTEFMRFEIDAERWPRTAAFVARVLGLEALARLRPFEDRAMRTRIPELREALAAMGAPVTTDTLGTDAPRRGLMRID